MKLLKENELVWSSVVANCRMNRKRKLTGVNSYEKDIGFDIIGFVRKKLHHSETVRWIDLCCGEGKALIEAGGIFRDEIANGEIILEGIDLVDMFESCGSEAGINFQVRSLLDWNPGHRYDLISCVHGLHYIGDKLEVIRKCLVSLKDNGMFIANMDLDNIRDMDGNSLKNKLIKKLKGLDIDYNSSKRMLICKGNRVMELEMDYLGADDTVGANYTGQEVIDSIYGC